MGVFLRARIVPEGMKMRRKWRISPPLQLQVRDEKGELRIYDIYTDSHAGFVGRGQTKVARSFECEERGKIYTLSSSSIEFSGEKGFTKSLAMTVLSEIGDKTFFAAAILAMRHPRRHVLSGCLGALIVMTILSAVVGWAAPNLISRKWTHHITTMLFLGFGLWTLRDAFKDGEAEELAEVEKELNADIKSAKESYKNDDDQKMKSQPLLAQFFSPILLKAFSITFFGEWGDKSQLATIGLAADENPLGVVLGGILGQALCTTAAVLGGKSLATQISEKIVALSAGVLFIVFGVQSFLSTVES